MTQQTQPKTCIVEWIEELDSILLRLEKEETALASEGVERKLSGSYYTPADVVAHFWQLFWRHHEISDRDSALSFIDKTQFIEPSVGSGIFLFGMMRSLAGFGIGSAEIAAVNFHAIDINQAAVNFVQDQLKELEETFSIRFKHIYLEHADFLTWISGRHIEATTFVGNPPFVTNERGSRWKNSFADFLEAIISSGKTNSHSLILPVSICFSRDYVALRRLLKSTGLALSASSYDNIPDCLFKSGKPESRNTNKANSQRCTILNLGGPRSGVVESSALLRWSARERKTFLAKTPYFYDCTDFDIERQIPRPTDQRLIAYLHEAAEGARSSLEFISKTGQGTFSMGSVARNYIGFRDYEGRSPGVIPVKTNEGDSSMILLQVFASELFYKYWRSFGDGFHVTNDLIYRFPISKGLLRICEENLDFAAKVWRKREQFAKTKLNSGRTVKSYDFSQAFAHIV